ncbi:hypothetical protein OHB41_00710 [Streptomyces sp. NBC_01571]|uniref:hypothetical protein n=1 Tax=Streptomyces sp. NBC_01571 TaxID=2975883 RepID=UPI00225ADE01|nr:hypothetical protein [Streptomyces sp. NBC_01571]MCX4571754.1 hypothetical protein [Streptomyces sp. NBC_01571]
MKVPFPLGSLLYAAGGLMGVCVTVMGAAPGSCWIRGGAWVTGSSWAWACSF